MRYFLSSHLLMSFFHTYSLTDMKNNGFSIASFLLFYVSTGFILLQLKKIVMDDQLWIPTSKDLENTKLHLVFTSCDHQSNQNNIKSLAMINQWSTVSTEKKLGKITILRWRKDTKDIKMKQNIM